MRICILSVNPKTEGLCQSVIDAVAKSAARAMAAGRKNGDTVY
ncbi:MAG: hypothetical protein ACM3TR_06710 [Caulobacteraceae bacterium]